MYRHKIVANFFSSLELGRLVLYACRLQFLKCTSNSVKIFWWHFKKWFQKTSCSDLKVISYQQNIVAGFFFKLKFGLVFQACSFECSTCFEIQICILMIYVVIFHGKYQLRFEFAKSGNTDVLITSYYF